MFPGSPDPSLLNTAALAQTSPGRGAGGLHSPAGEEPARLAACSPQPQGDCKLDPKRSCSPGRRECSLTAGWEHGISTGGSPAVVCVDSPGEDVLKPSNPYPPGCLLGYKRGRRTETK